MPDKPTQWTTDTLLSELLLEVQDMHDAGTSRRVAAQIVEEKTGRRCTPDVMRNVFRRLDLMGNETPRVEVRDVSPPSEDGEKSIDELIEDRVKASKRKALRADVHKRTLQLPAEPLGVMVFGDPHVDNEGCDWEALSAHVRLAQETEGVMGVCVGDLNDNWVGRLSKLYSKASMSATDGWRLSQWLLESLQWLAIVGGNHDEWSHSAGVDPLKWISDHADVKCYAPDEIRLTLTWKDEPALEPIVWVIRHDFSGRSWYHPTHGPHKEAMLDGRCHILTAGHLHQWGSLVTEHRQNRVTIAARVRGYKRNDDFARSKGFFEQKYGESALLVLNPYGEGPAKVQIFFDLEVGCQVLQSLREAHNAA